MAAQPWTTVQQYADALGDMDDALQQKARLGIMSCTTAAGEISFKQLKVALQLTDGNLSSHLTFLEKRAYIEVTKGFEGKKPHTLVRATERGHQALADYIAALERLVTTHKQEGKRNEQRV